ncbi:MAG: DegT/DnrJ/EryC1/StrS family aminotransferase [Rhodospirillales bacterium]|nr:DegT/DnrJ/EryC1/StrS family aminotransferase [Rhodospirillales bacterium]
MEKLAIHGGQPVRAESMPERFSIGPAEKAMMHEVLEYYEKRDSDFGYQGHFEEHYCQLFVDAMGGGYADSVATGTAALYVAVAAMNLPKGSEVIVSPITDPGSLSPIILNDLVPVPADSMAGSYNTGPDQILARITPNTSAVFVVHATGQAVEIDKIVEIAKERNILVLEDCSQAHGALWKGKPVGTFGDIAAFSTGYRKNHISGGSGGMVYSQDEDLFNLAIAHADRGKPRWRDDFDDRNPTNYLFPALNLHTDEISCAMGISSFSRLPETIAKRLAYIKAVADGIEKNCAVCQVYPWSGDDSPFFYPVIVDIENINCSKIEFAEAIRAEGIGLNPHYEYVVSEWAWLQKFLKQEYDCPNAIDIKNRSFNLYVNEKYGPQEAEDTVQALLKVESFFTS